MDSSDDLDLSAMAYEDKLKLAIETVINDQLRDNHDDTLVEKLCTLLARQIDSEQLKSFVEQKQILQLIDNKIQALGDCNVDTLIEQKGLLEIVLRITGSMFCHVQVFKLISTDNVFMQSFPQLMKMIMLDSFPKMTIKCSVFSFLNNVFQHEPGSRWILNILFEEDHQNSAIQFESFIKLFLNKNTKFIEKEMLILLANIINCPLLEPQTLAKIRQVILKNLFQPFDVFTCKFLLNLIPFIQEKKTLVEEFEILPSINRLVRTVNGDEVLDLIKILHTIHVNQAANILGLIEKLESKLRFGHNCFHYIQLMGTFVDVDYCINSVPIRKRWLELMMTVFACIKDRPNADSAGCLVRETFSSTSPKSFEINSLKLLSKVDVKALEQEEVDTLIGGISSILTTVDNRKCFLQLLAFLEEIIDCHLNNFAILIKILSIYCDTLPRMTNYHIFTIKSIQKLIECKTISSGNEFLACMNGMLSQFNHLLCVVQLENDLELVEVITETVLHLALNLNFETVLHREDLCCVEFCVQLRRFIDLQTSLLGNDCLEETTKANLLSSLFYTSKYFNGNDLVEEAFDTIEDYDLTFRQVFFTNIRDYLKIYSIQSENFNSLLSRLCRICASETDFEMQLILLDIIDSQPIQIEGLHKFGIFQLLCFLLADPAISYRVKLRALILYDQLHSKLDLKLLDHTFHGVTPAAAREFYQQFDSKTFRDRLKSESPKLDLLDDILSSSKVFDDFVMDCY